MPVRVLFVCTGNVCRSPSAELLLRARSADGRVAVSSAGMYALVDLPIDPPTASALADLGIDSSRHRARQFESWMVDAADLVLTAEVGHRDQIMVEVPTSFRRVFTIKEFVRLVDGFSDGDAASAIRFAAAARGNTGETVDTDDDIVDPFGAPVSRARETVAEIDALIGPITDALGLISG